MKAIMTKYKYTLIVLLLGGLALLRAQTPQIPVGILGTGFENHIELEWQASTGATGYKIFRSDNGTDFTLLKQVGKTTIAEDWTGDEGQNLTRQYKIKALGLVGAESDFSAMTAATTHPMSDEELLDMVQRSSFRFFWDFGHPVSGMARDRNNGDDNIVTSGGTGFGVMAIVVATERGWVTRAEAVDRMIKIVSFLQFADRFHGAYPHFMNGTTGNTIAFSQYDDGADLVETAFLIQGLLAARKYFDQNTPLEIGLRDAINGIWQDVEWDWFRKNNGPVLYWHWSPNYAWQMNFPLRGFFEAQIVYILAVASPTHPVPGSLYQTGWTSSNYANPSIHFGHKIYCGPFGGGPLFFAHYSYLGFDPRNVKDAFCNYFVRNRNHSLIQQAYSIANPENHVGYSAECWGLTASDDPFGYLAHDIWPTNDNGTISPTAALSSMPYTPEESLGALKYFYRNQGEKLWGPYGFYDAFNLDQNWFADSYLAIDQGPIVDMIENYRTGLLWEKFMQNAEIQPALTAMGFVADNSPTNDLAKSRFSATIFPNPLAVNGDLSIEFTLLDPQILNAEITDTQGRLQQTLFTKKAMQSGVSTQSFVLKNLPAGTYFLHLQNSKNQEYTRKIIVH